MSLSKKYLSVLLLAAILPFSLYMLGNKISFFGRAYRSLTGTKAYLVADLKTTFPYSPTWKYLAQGGEERNGMLESVVSPVRALSPAYIRLDHIYDFYDVVSRSPNGQLNFNWTKLDIELRRIKEMGAIPFISLSYMPPAISSGSEIDLPNSWADWQIVVRRTVEHISGNRGLAIPGVYYEVWNEPDLFGGFTIGGQKDYIKLYSYAAKGAGDAQGVLPYKIGGPSTTGLYKNWITGFLNAANRQNLRVDFLSWHVYSKDLLEFEKQATDIKDWILAYPRYGNSVFVISESGINSENDPLYDSKFSAIHTLAVQAAIGRKIPMIFNFEIKDGPGPQKYWGRWGILTHEKYGVPEKKPRYFAFSFLNEMNSREGFTVNGQGSWIKAFGVVSGQKYKMLVVNYDMWGSHTEDVLITFANVPYSKFKYSRKDFLGGMSSRDVSIEGTGYTTVEKILPNSAAILEIEAI